MTAMITRDNYRNYPTLMASSNASGTSLYSSIGTPGDINRTRLPGVSIISTLRLRFCVAAGLVNILSKSIGVTSLACGTGLRSRPLRTGTSGRDQVVSLPVSVKKLGCCKVTRHVPVTTQHRGNTHLDITPHTGLFRQCWHFSRSSYDSRSSF